MAHCTGLFLTISLPSPPFLPFPIWIRQQPFLLWSMKIELGRDVIAYHYYNSVPKLGT